MCRVRESRQSVRPRLIYAQMMWMCVCVCGIEFIPCGSSKFGRFETHSSLSYTYVYDVYAGCVRTFTAILVVNLMMWLRPVSLAGAEIRFGQRCCETVSSGEPARDVCVCDNIANRSYLIGMYRHNVCVVCLYMLRAPVRLLV